MSTSELENDKSQNIIFYKGQVTEVIDAGMGIYELDKKLLLYTTILNSSLAVFKRKDDILVSNVHIILANEKKFLICCILSCVKICNDLSSVDVTISDGSTNDFINEHIACFPNLFVKNSFINFNSYIIEQFLWNAFYYRYYKTEREKGQLCQKYCGQFFSIWHPRSVCKKPFLEDYKIPSLSFLISEAKPRIVWSKYSTTWDHCIVRNNESYVCVGFLFMKEDGCFMFSDSQTEIPCVFIDDFAQSSSDTNCNFICEILCGAVGCYVTLKKFCFAFEKFSSGIHMSNNYICVSLSDIELLEKVSCMNTSGNIVNSHFSSKNFYDDVAENKACFQPTQSVLDIDENISSLLKEKLTLHSHVKSTSNCGESDIKMLYTCKEVRVLAKTWSLDNEKLVFCKAFAILYGERSVYVKGNNFSSVTDVSDVAKLHWYNEDLESCMERLTLEPKPIVLNFYRAASTKCATLIPGHKYKLFILHKENETFVFKKNSKKFAHMCKLSAAHALCINVNVGTAILHSPDCSAKDEPVEEDCIYNSKIQNVKNIISKRNIAKDCILRAVLVEKSFEKDFSSLDKKILRLILKDIETADTISAYIFCYPTTLYGLLPGVTLELVGCLCICSQKGNLYLRSSDCFGVHIVNLLRSSPASVLSSNRVEESDIFLLKNLTSPDCPMNFKCINGFFLRITLAQIDLVCVNCFESRTQNRTCKSDYVVMAEVCFEVDDGSNAVSIHGSGDILRQLLKLSEDEWNAFFKHVLETKQGLKFFHFEKPDDDWPFMKKLLYYLCSNKSFCRPVVVSCYIQRISDGRNELLPSCVCYSLSEFSVEDTALQLYLSLMKAG